MRIVCVQPARDPVLCGQGPVWIGGAPEDDIVLTGDGVAPHHLSIVADRRGLILAVAAARPRVYVNARAVRERALLHHGDTLSLGSHRLQVTSDTAAQTVPVSVLPCAEDEIEPVTLRVVSGVGSGQTLAVKAELHLGVGSVRFPELPFACRIAQTREGLVFESNSTEPCINGWHCRCALLGPGDQIALSGHRLVVEAPGLQYAAHAASLPPASAPMAEREQEPNTSAPNGMWWLIIAAAVLALVIALVLYFHE